MKNYTSPKISACLIVRDEAHCLADCLDRLQALADEIIIVDTGSSDRTLSIARQYTDRVFHFEWSDNFAAARNAALAEAKGDWILVVDADEILPETTAQAILHVLKSSVYKNRPLVFNFRVRTPGQSDLFSRGLFPNGFGIHFVGRVHEIPVLPNAEILPLYHCHDWLLEHRPYSERSYKKTLYYQDLLQQALAETNCPRLRNHFFKHLGLSLLQTGQLQTARQMLQQCYAGFEALGITAADGFYQEVVQGLAKTTPVSVPGIVKHTFAALAITTSLAACQTPSGHVPSDFSPSLQKTASPFPWWHDAGLLPALRAQLDTDFKIQAVGYYRRVTTCDIHEAHYQCGSIGRGYDPVVGCYQSGGFPVWTELLTCGPIPGKSCSGVISDAVVHACDMGSGEVLPNRHSECLAGFEKTIPIPGDAPSCYPCPSPLLFTHTQDGEIRCSSKEGLLVFDAHQGISLSDYPQPQTAVPVFSPRNQDEVLDQLTFQVGSAESLAGQQQWQLGVVQYLSEEEQAELSDDEWPYRELHPLFDSEDNELLNTGIKSLLLTGFESGECLPDGRYGLKLHEWVQVDAYPTSEGLKSFYFETEAPVKQQVVT